MVIRSLFLCFLFVQLCPAKFYESNVTDLSKCKVHYSRSESTYQHFFELADESRGNGTLLDFHFSVLAPSDAHILLAPSNKLERQDPVYEIVLGAGGNTFCDIRRMQKASVKASLRIKGLLSALDPTSFWLHISKDGLIDVGRQGEEIAFISWRDPDPLPLKVFSFCTWPGVEAKWYFDCPREDNTTGNSTEIQRNLTDLEHLRKDVLFNYDPYVRPVFDVNDITTIMLTLAVEYISLNEYKSTLQIEGDASLVWTDEKLKWDPANYGGLKYLHITHREIWQPDFVLLNSVDDIDILGNSLMVATSDGTVSWKPKIHINAWCDATNLGHWPEDTHSCDISLSFPRDIDSLQLQFNGSANSVQKNENLEWTILDVTSVYGGRYNITTKNTHPDPAFLQMTFKMKRSSNVYTAVFFTPFLVIAVAMLATFCVSPFGHLKMSLNCLQLVMSTIALVGLAVFIPGHPKNVPYLVNLYSYTLVASAICIGISTYVINLSRTPHKYSVPYIISKMLLSWPVQRSLCLPQLKVPKEYGKLDEVTVPPSMDSSQDIWILSGVAIDRIAFIIYFCLFLFALCFKY